jgi:hypothetical protein
LRKLNRKEKHLCWGSSASFETPDKRHKRHVKTVRDISNFNAAVIRKTV